jgi:hypothetical protein
VGGGGVGDGGAGGGEGAGGGDGHTSVGQYCADVASGMR